MSTPRHPASGQFVHQDQGGAADQWADLAGSLPTHDGEVMASHEGQPTVAEQDRTHGAGLPDVDLGPEPGTVVGATPGQVIGGAIPA